MCHHPVWGGWFALRGVAIIPDTRVDLAQPQVDQSLSLSPDQAVDMITLYNECWQVKIHIVLSKVLFTSYNKTCVEIVEIRTS